MTIADLESALEPIADAALRSPDPDVHRLSVVLGAILGAIAGGPPLDHEVIDAMAIHAGLICEHRSGMHATSKAKG